MKIVPEMEFSLTDIKRCYRLNEVEETKDGFYVIPASRFQGHELFFIPRTLPVKDLESRIPYDLLASVPEGIILEIIRALDINEVIDDTYDIQARFVEYSPEGVTVPSITRPMAVVKPVNPREATHIQLTGSKDIYYGRGNIMCPPTPIEERLDYISTRHYVSKERTQGYLYLEWLLPCDYRTLKIRREWAEYCEFYD